jgi:hypothetical protein
VKSFSFLGAFKGHVFPEMSEALLFWVLISAANIEDKSTVHHAGMRDLLMDNPNPIGKLFTSQLHTLWLRVGEKGTRSLVAVRRILILGNALFYYLGNIICLQ